VKMNKAAKPSSGATGKKKFTPFRKGDRRNKTKKEKKKRNRSFGQGKGKNSLVLRRKKRYGEKSDVLEGITKVGRSPTSHGETGGKGGRKELLKAGGDWGGEKRKKGGGTRVGA